jgi:gluconolactonase
MAFRGLLALAAVATWSVGGWSADEKKDEGDEAQKKKKVETELVAIGPVKYPVPKTWIRQQPANSMRLAQFGVPTVEGEKGRIEMVVSSFVGGGGGVQANLDRWKGQFDSIEGEPKIEKIEVEDATITTFDATGVFIHKDFPMQPKGELKPGWRMLAAIVELPDRDPYFFKLVGPQRSVGAQAESFERMFKECKPSS